jgi:putative acetyltransferase
MQVPIQMKRKAIETDFSFIYGLYMHPQVNRHLLYEQMTEQAFRPIFNDLLQNSVLYIYEVNTIPVGMFKLVHLPIALLILHT